MKYIRRLDRKARRQYAVLTVLFIIGAFMETASIAMVLPFLKRFISGESDPGKVFGMACVVLLCFVVKNLYLYVIHILKRKFVMKHYRNTAANMLGIYLNEPYSFHVEHNSGILVNNINIYTVRFFNYIQAVMDLVAEVSVAAVLFIYMCTVNFKISLLACLMFLMITLILRKAVYPKLKAIQKESNSAFDRMHVVATQAMHAIKEVKVYSVEEEIGRTYDENILVNTSNEVRASRFNGLPSRIIELAAVGGMLAFLTFMTAKGDEADTLAFMAVIALVLVRLMPGVNRINSYLSSLATYRAVLERSDGEFSEVLERAGRNTSEGHSYSSGERKKAEKLPAGSGYELVFDSVSFSYAEGADIFKDTSVRVAKGSTIGLKGPSGEGKSTFMNLLLGLLEPTEGSIYVMSEGRKVPLSSLKIGYIPQDIYIMDSTVKDNIVFFREYDEEKLRKAITLARLDKVVDGLKNGADTRIGERGIRLSGGQNQRIGIARALYDDPDLLLLDEATSSLDNALEKEIMDDVYTLKGGRTIIIAAHRLSTLDGCDVVYEVGNRTVSPSKEN